MIPADRTASAIFRDAQGQASYDKTIVAWDTDGHPLIAGEQGLIRAEDHGDFHSVLEDTAGLIVGAVPGGGWLITTTEEDGSEYTDAIVAWAVYADGTAMPIGTDNNGLTDDATKALGKGHAAYRIHHPSQRWVPSAS